MQILCRMHRTLSTLELPSTGLVLSTQLAFLGLVLHDHLHVVVSRCISVLATRLEHNTLAYGNIPLLSLCLEHTGLCVNIALHYVCRYSPSNQGSWATCCSWEYVRTVAHICVQLMVAAQYVIHWKPVLMIIYVHTLSFQFINVFCTILCSCYHCIILSLNFVKDASGKGFLHMSII
jgi:hypothetical protein